MSGRTAKIVWNEKLKRWKVLWGAETCYDPVTFELLTWATPYEALRYFERLHPHVETAIEWHQFEQDDIKENDDKKVSLPEPLQIKMDI